MPQSASTSFYITGGTLPPDAPCYVTRRADRELLDALKQGDYCYVLNSRQMGKSSLMARAAESLQASGVSVLILDLQKYGSNLTAVQWYRGMLQDIVERLHITDEAVGYWEAHRDLGPLNRFLNIIRDYVLPALKSPLVIFIDEIDYVRSLPFSTDEFFAGIRDCYNRRAEEASYRRLTFCLLGVAIPAELIRDPRTTPFNIGRRIELQDFTPEETAPLAMGLISRQDSNSSPGNRRLLDRVLYWTGGHPYLTQRLCSAISQDGAVQSSADVDRVCEDFFLSRKGQKTDDNLIFVRNRIVSPAGDQVGLLELYRRVWENKPVRDDDTSPMVSHLRLSGIVRSEKGRLVVRNRIYRRVFDRQWVIDHLPDAELLRQRAAYRKGVIRTLVGAGVIILAMAGLSVFALLKASEASQKKDALAAANADLKQANSKLQDQQTRLETSDAAKDRANKELEAQKSTLKTVNMDLESANSAKEQAIRALELTNRQLKKTHSSLVKRTREAQSYAVSERKQREIAELSLYPNYTSYASRALEYTDDLETANDVLNRGAPGLRDFVWHYLKRSVTDNSYRVVAAPLPEDAIQTVTWSPESGRVACTGKTHSLYLLNNDTGAVKARLPADGAVTRTVFADRGRLLAAGGGNNEVSFWNTDTRKVTEKALNLYPKANPSGDSKYWVLSLAFSSNEKWLAVGLRHGYIRLWNRETGKLLDRYIHDTDCDIACVAFSPDGTLLARGSQWNVWPEGKQGKDAIRLWNPQTGESVCQLTVPGDHEMTAVAFSPDGKRLVAGAKDGTVVCWSVKDVRVDHARPHAVKEHNEAITGLCFSPDGKWMASASMDSTIKIWDMSETDGGGPPLYVSTFRGHTKPIVGLAFLPDGKTLVSGSEDSTLRTWSLEEAQTPLRAHSSGVKGLVYSRDGARILTFSDEAGGDSSGQTNTKITVWNAQTRKPVQSFGCSNTGDTQAALSPDGRLAAIYYVQQGEKTGLLSSLALWDVNNNKVIGGFTDNLEGTEQLDGISCMAFSPDGKLLATGAKDPVAENHKGSHSFRVYLWDIASRKAVGYFKAHVGWVQCLAFSPDSRTLVTGGGENSVRFWDVTARKEILTLPTAHNGYLISLAFSRKGDWIASSGADRAVRLWQWDKKKRTITGAPVQLRYPDAVTSLDFSPDGSILATGDGGGVLKLWSLRSGSKYIPEELTKRLNNQGIKGISRIAFSPTEQTLAIAGGSGRMIFLDAAPVKTAPTRTLSRSRPQSAARKRLVSVP